MTMPASSDREMPTAVSHRHRFVRVRFPLAIFESSGFSRCRGQNYRGCPQIKLQGSCQRLNERFLAVFRGFDEYPELRAGQLERAFNQFDRYLTGRSDEPFLLSKRFRKKIWRT
jgi:hypothetical protein